MEQTTVDAFVTPSAGPRTVELAWVFGAAAHPVR